MTGPAADRGRARTTSAGSTRERDIAAAFVALAGGLTRSRGPLALAEQLTSCCADLADVTSAGLLLADSRGRLAVVAASTADTRRLEAFQVQRAEGPCHDCYTTGAPVLIPDLTVHHARWPSFVPAALRAGFASVHALPMRRRSEALGALNLFRRSPGSLPDGDLSLAQALADVASAALVQDRTARLRAALNDQLQAALDSRLVIEQAKGVLAQSGGRTVDDAWAVLREYARNQRRTIDEVARDVVSRVLPAADVLHHRPSPGGPGSPR